MIHHWAMHLNALSVNISNYLNQSNTLHRPISVGTLRSGVAKNDPKSRLSCNFDIPKSAKTTSNKSCINTTRNHSLKKLHAEKSITRNKQSRDSNEEGKRRSRITCFETTQRIHRGQNPKQQTSNVNSGNITSKSNKTCNKKLTLNGRGTLYHPKKQEEPKNHVRNISSQLANLSEKRDSDSARRFDNLVKELFADLSSATTENLRTLCSSIRGRLLFERTIYIQEIDHLKEQLHSKTTEVNSLIFQRKFLRQQLQLTNKKIERLNMKHSISPLRLAPKSISVQTEVIPSDEQFTALISQLDRRLDETKLKVSLYQKMLCIIRAESSLDLDNVYDRAKQEQEECGDTWESNGKRKKIKVHITNHSSQNADISSTFKNYTVINDSGELSFNYADKQSDTEQYEFFKTKKSIPPSSKLMLQFKQCLKLDFQKLQRSDISDTNEQNL